MHRLFLLLFLLIPFQVQALECSEDHKIQTLLSPCQAAYYKFAPECNFGDGVCLSLILHGLVTKDLFGYRPDLRRVYNTPLKRKVYMRTREYQIHYRKMLVDLETAKSISFCAEMKSYWLYDLRHKGFGFLPHTIIPKGKLFRPTNIQRVSSYEFIPCPEAHAIDIESWETIASSKYVFFNLDGPSNGYIPISYTKFVWLVPTITFDFEGIFQATYEEGCQTPPFFEFRVEQ